MVLGVILLKNSLDCSEGPDQQNNVPQNAILEITFANQPIVGTAFQVSKAIFAWRSTSTEYDRSGLIRSCSGKPLVVWHVDYSRRVCARSLGEEGFDSTNAIRFGTTF